METNVNFNVVSVQHLQKDELFSFSTDGKTFRVKETVRKRKFYHLKIVDSKNKTKLNRKFSNNKAKTVPIYLKTPLKDTQIPHVYITRMSTISNN